MDPGCILDSVCADSVCTDKEGGQPQGLALSYVNERVNNEALEHRLPARLDPSLTITVIDALLLQ